ncbi:MAG: WbqC family protein [Bacteroidota bacterium]
MGKRIAIVQSNYIPWKGYFDMINAVDEFVLYDDAQYTKRDWRNRNKIKTAQGPQWLTVPVEVKGKYFQKIRDTRIADPKWAAKHWNTILLNYKKAPAFAEVRDWLEPIYREREWGYLSELNFALIAAVNAYLGIDTKLSWSSDYSLPGGPTENLLAVCQQAGASAYLSGPRAKDYMQLDVFAAAGISVEWMGYDGYPEYAQFHPPFEHGVSVIDLLMQTGKQAVQSMNSFN